MQIVSGVAVLGTFAALLSTVAFVPQIMKIWKTGGEDVSYFMLALYVAGVALWLGYGLAIGAAALSLANAVSIVFAGTCLILKFMKRPTPIPIEKKRLRIAIDMDGTIADSVKEHLRRYNAEFAEMISTDDLYGKHLEEIAPLDRREAVRRAVRDESFFDCLDVIEGAKQLREQSKWSRNSFASMKCSLCPRPWKFQNRSRQNTDGCVDIFLLFRRGTLCFAATKASLMPIT